MRFEVKTDQSRISENFSWIILISMLTFLGILLSNLTISVGKISKIYELEFLCKRILVEKSSKSFKRFSKLTNQPNKQKIWDLCKEIS